MQTQTFDIGQIQSQALDAQARAASDRLNSLAKAKPENETELRETAQDFEAVFLSQMLKPMFETVKTDSMFGGGHGEDAYRGMMVDEVGKSIAKSGGIGIADSVYRELLKLQEM